MRPTVRPTEPDRIAATAEVPVTAWSFGTDPDAPVVLAVHDFTANGLWFGDLAEACGPGVRLVAPDLRGRGASVAAPPPGDIDVHVADLIGLADRTGAATFPIVGHGTGAMLALTVATVAPSRVTRVVVLDGPPAVPTGTADDWRAAAARVDPGVARLGRTWAHRDEPLTEGRRAGRLPATGMTRALRRAVDAEVTGAGFGWRARLGSAALERDWRSLSTWTPPSTLSVPLHAFHARHGHRVDDPPVATVDLGTGARMLATTHTGLLVDLQAVGEVADTIIGSIASTDVNR